MYFLEVLQHFTMRRAFSATVPVRTFNSTQNLSGCGLYRGTYRNTVEYAVSKPECKTMASFSLLYEIGSRHETGTNLGVTHFLRAGTIMTSGRSTGFLRSRCFQQQGAQLSVSGNRQFTAFTIKAPPPVMEDVAGALFDCSINNNYSEWEMDTVRDIVREDLTRRDPLEHVLDLVQKAAFTNSLNNSVYCEEERINDISGEDIHNFVHSVIASCRGSIGCCGSSVTVVEQVADLLFQVRVDCLPENVGIKTPWCSRSGYEYYDTGPGTTYIALAVPGTGLCDIKCCLKYAILSAALGNTYVAQGQHEMDHFLQGPIGYLSNKNDPRSTVSAFHIPYCDTGSFVISKVKTPKGTKKYHIAPLHANPALGHQGKRYTRKQERRIIVVKTYSEMARCMGLRAAEFLHNVCHISPEQIQMGKKRLQLGLTMGEYKTTNASLNLALQSLLNLPLSGPEDLNDIIAQIPVEEIQCVARNVSNACRCKLAMAVLGDVEAAPHDGEIHF